MPRAQAAAEPKRRRARKDRRKQPSTARASHFDARQADLVTLQQTVGNQAVARWVGGGVVQTQEGQPEPKEAGAKAGYDMGSPVKDAKESFYAIEETRLSDVLAKFKFKDEKGKPLAAETTWDVKSTFSVARKGGKWEADPIAWTYSTRVELPEWTGFSKAGEAEKREWARFIKATRAHEQGHVDRVKKYMDAEMPDEHKKASAATKAALEKRLKKTTKDVGDELKRISDKYDVDTTHGASQGATLKPPTAAKP